MWFDSKVFTSWLSRWLTKWLAKNYGFKKIPRLKARWVLHSDRFSLTTTGDFKMILPIDKVLNFALSYVDGKGNLAAVEGLPVISIDRADLATVTVHADGFSGTIVALGPLGSAQVSATVDADLGTGVKTVTTLGTIDFVAGEAVSGVFNFGEPVVPAPVVVPAPTA